MRARRFDPEKAQKQFADSEAWRTKHNVDELYANFPTDEFEDSKRFYPRWTGRRDKVWGLKLSGVVFSADCIPKNGLPLYVYRLQALDSGLMKELNSVPPERRYQRM